MQNCLYGTCVVLIIPTNTNKELNAMSDMFILDMHDFELNTLKHDIIVISTVSLSWITIQRVGNGLAFSSQIYFILLHFLNSMRHNISMKISKSTEANISILMKYNTNIIWNTNHFLEWST